MKFTGNIRGSMAFKCVTYLVVALLAFGTVYYGGLTYEGICAGFSATDFDRPEVYADAAAGAYTDKLGAYSSLLGDYIESRYTSITSVSADTVLDLYDVDDDSVIGVDDLVQTLSEKGFASYCANNSNEYAQLTRDDAVAYRLDVTYIGAYGEGTVDEFTPTAGNTELLNKSDTVSSFSDIYTVISTDTVRYLRFDSWDELEAAYTAADRLSTSYLEGGYIYNEDGAMYVGDNNWVDGEDATEFSTEYVDEYEYVVEENADDEMATTEVTVSEDGTASSAEEWTNSLKVIIDTYTDEDSGDSIETSVSELLNYYYNGRPADEIEYDYCGDARYKGDDEPGGYVLKQTFKTTGEIDIASTAYVDLDAYGAQVDSTNSELKNNLDIWANNFTWYVTAFAICGILCLIAVLFALANAGVKRPVPTGDPDAATVLPTDGAVGKISKVRLSGIERIPTELVLVLLLGAVLCVAVGVAGGIMNMAEDGVYDGNYSLASDRTLYAVCAACSAGVFAIGVMLVGNLIAKLRVRQLVKESILLRIFGWIHRNIFGRIARCVRYVRSRLTVTWQGVLIYAVITIIELVIAFILYEAGNGFVFGLAFAVCVIAKWLEIIAVVAFVIQTQELYKCAKDMAAGNLDRKADTRRMVWAFKAHGEHLNNISEGMAVAVEERMKSEHLKTELITNVSHDIKTPLTSIINYVDLLGKGELDPETEEEYIAVLSRQSARLKKLIEDLIEASKASTGNVKITFERIDANTLLEQAIAEYADRLDEAGLKLVFTKCETPAYVMADGRHLWRVFDNLLGNARKYAMAGTRVYASVKTVGGRVVIEFKNISRDELNVSSDELMERFVRGDSSRNTEGSGLGLSIAKSLCALMKADFCIDIDGDMFKAIIEFDMAEEAALTNDNE